MATIVIQSSASIHHSRGTIYANLFPTPACVLTRRSIAKSSLKCTVCSLVASHNAGRGHAPFGIELT